MNNLNRRLEKLEHTYTQRERDKVVGVFRQIVDPSKPLAQMRYAESGDLTFTALPDETEGEFCDSISGVMGNNSDSVWRVVMYANNPKARD